MTSRAGVDFSAAWFDWFVKTRPTANAYLKGGSNGTLTWSAASPSAGAFTNPDYIFYRDGTTYNGLNGRTGAIDYTEDTAVNADACVDCLQDTIDNTIATYGHGAIYFMPGASYVFTAKEIVHTTGNIFLVSDGAYLDIKACTGDVFDFGDDATSRTLTLENAHMTGMRGFVVKGDAANANTKLMTIRSICRPINFSDISFNRVNNLLELRGNAYSVDIHNVRGAYVKGTGIKTVETATGAPNGIVIDAVEISNSVAETSSIGIDLGGATMDSVKVCNCWIEKFNVGIKVGSRYTMIHDNFISSSLGVAPKGVYLTADCNYDNISDNFIYVADGGYGVYCDSTSSFHSVNGNRFYSSGVCIYSSTAWIGGIVGNEARFIDTVGTKFVAAPVVGSSISVNTIYGDTNHVIGVSGIGKGNAATGNVFRLCLIGWDDTGGTYTNLVGNTFYDCGTDIDDLDATSVSEHNMSA